MINGRHTIPALWQENSENDTSTTWWAAWKNELHEKNEPHEKWAARISIKNFTRNEIARTSEFLPPLCIVKCQQKEKKEEQISEWNLFSTTQDSSQLYLLEDLRNRNSLCCNSLHDLRFLPGDLSCIRCSCNSISWLIWHSTPRKIGCTAVIGILCRTAPSYCGILAKLSLPDCALRLEPSSTHQNACITSTPLSADYQVWLHKNCNTIADSLIQYKSYSLHSWHIFQNNKCILLLPTTRCYYYD